MRCWSATADGRPQRCGNRQYRLNVRSSENRLAVSSMRPPLNVRGSEHLRVVRRGNRFCWLPRSGFVQREFCQPAGAKTQLKISVTLRGHEPERPPALHLAVLRRAAPALRPPGEGRALRAAPRLSADDRRAPRPRVLVRPRALVHGASSTRRRGSTATRSHSSSGTSARVPASRSCSSTSTWRSAATRARSARSATSVGSRSTPAPRPRCASPSKRRSAACTSARAPTRAAGRRSRADTATSSQAAIVPARRAGRATYRYGGMLMRAAHADRFGCVADQVEP